MSRQFRFVVTIIHSMLFTITAAVLLATFFFTFPALESQFAPVTGKLHITEVGVTEEGHSIIEARFNKVRQCEYLGIAWFNRSENGTLEQVPIEQQRKAGDSSSPNRPVGWQTTGPWIVHIPPELLRDNSVVKLMHRCHPLWLTTTDFYP